MTAADLERLHGLGDGPARLQWVYGQSTLAEERNGINAYRRYNHLLDLLSAKTRHSLRTACGVFSALSPNNDYLGNLTDATAVLMARAAGKSIDSFKVHTYHGNKRKAWDIANGREPTEVIHGLKTLNFFHNLLTPDCREHVTIDGHMANIWLGQRLPLQTRNKDKRAVAITKSLYSRIAKDVRTLADFNGLVPCQMQAILWLTWRRLHGIKTDGQARFWDLDVERAGLGFRKVA